MEWWERYCGRYREQISYCDVAVRQMENHLFVTRVFTGINRPG